MILLATAFAQQPTISWYHAEEGPRLEVHVQADLEVDVEAVRLSVQDRPATVESVDRFGDTGRGATIALLIDTVGYKSDQQAALREAGRAFVENMAKNDSAAILGVGDGLHGLDKPEVFSSDPAVLYAQLEALPFGQDNYTALWRSCMQALDAMDVNLREEEAMYHIRIHAWYFAAGLVPCFGFTTHGCIRFVQLAFLFVAVNFGTRAFVRVRHASWQRASFFDVFEGPVFDLVPKLCFV